MREINWRREAIYPAQALAEACLVAPWLLLFLSLSTRISPERVTLECLAVILATLYLARAMDALRIHPWLQRAVVLAGILGLSALVLRELVSRQPYWAGQDWAEIWLHPAILIDLAPGAALVLLSVIWLCWRGLRLADRPISVMDAALGFHLGIIVLALFAVVSAAQAVTIFVPAFFFSELLSMGLTRVEAASHTSAGRRLPFSGWWLTMLVGSTGTLITLAGMITAVVLGMGMSKLFSWLGPVLVILALPLAVILAPLMALIEWLLRSLEFSLGPVLSELARLAQQFQALLSRVTRQPSPIIATVLRALIYVVIAAVGLGVLYVLALVILKVGRRRLSAENDRDEERESLWSSQVWARKLRERLRQRLANLRRLAGIVGRFGAGGLVTALTIRRIYAQTVKLAASRGYPRPVAHTPYEHLTTLQQAFPDCDADLAQITEAYVGVHYGELPEEPDALETIRAAFERIRSTDAPTQKDVANAR